jgi:hypothetical protein
MKAITETITFRFEDADQQKRFHDRLRGENMPNPVALRKPDNVLYEHFRREFARELLLELEVTGDNGDALVAALYRLSRKGCWGETE